MASVSSYGHFSPDDIRECEHWNAARTANPTSPEDHQHFTTGYESYEQLKAALDEFTLNAGFKTHVRGSHEVSKRLYCSKGNKRMSRSTGKKESTTKKCDCKWAALAQHIRKERVGGTVYWCWTLKIDSPVHKDHGPELSPESHRGYAPATKEIKEFCTAEAEADPTITPSALERALLKEFPNAKVTKSWAKNFLGIWRMVKREDIGAYWWLERDLAEHDPVLLVGPMAKARKLPGHPCGTGTFNANERSVFGQQVMENKTVHNTTSMGKKNKTGAGSASVTRVFSAHEYKSSTLDSLNEEDELANQKAAQKNEALQNALLQPKKRGRPPRSKNKPKDPPDSTAPAALAAADPTATPPAKRKYTSSSRKTVNNLSVPEEPAEDWA